MKKKKLKNDNLSLEISNNNQAHIVQGKETFDSTNEKTLKERFLSIDRFRGFCMFFMFLSYLLPLFSAFEFLSPLVEHYKDINSKVIQILPRVSFSDLFAPMFIFCVGLTIVKSFKSREAKYGTSRAYLQLTTRFLALIGLGLLLNGFENGWADIFQKGIKEFDGFSIQIKIYSVLFWVGVAMLIPILVSRFLKNEKFKFYSVSVFKYFLAIVGILGLYFILVAQAQKLVANPHNLYGGWEWDTLQNIGLAGLFALPFIALSKWIRLSVVVGVLFIMTVLYQNGLLQVDENGNLTGIARDILEGGVIGGVQWACILLLGSIYFDFKDSPNYWIIASTFMLIAVGGVIGFGFYAQKRGATPMYALFTSSVSAIIYGIFVQFDKWKFKYDFFADWGSSAMLVYIVTWLFIGALLGGLAEEKLAALPKWSGWMIALLFIGAFSAGNWFLRRKNIHIRI